MEVVSQLEQEVHCPNQTLIGQPRLFGQVVHGLDNGKKITQDRPAQLNRIFRELKKVMPGKPNKNGKV